MDEPIRPRRDDEPHEEPEPLPVSPARVAYWQKLARDFEETAYPI